MAAEPIPEVPFVPWAEFLPSMMQAWAENAQGKAEHMTMVGPTGQGKTTLALALLNERVRLFVRFRRVDFVRAGQGENDRPRAVRRTNLAQSFA